ncbi:MAG: hypothetical protein CSB55_04585 [Candidatus Cloacimonadota bacterium]|nr:MAG: hypothetical protein CSB55_04585 [Candidatus Cloacimonadota bacterium]
MKRLNLVLLIVTTVLFLASCGGGLKSPEKIYTPGWWRVQDNNDFIYSYGKAEKTRENASFDAARSNAFLEASQYVEAHVQGLVKDFMQETGGSNPQVTELTSKAVRTVTDADFSGAMVSNSETVIMPDGRYKTFVRISIPKETVNKNLVNNIKNEEALYNEFKASQAFKELDEAVN